MTLGGKFVACRLSLITGHFLLVTRHSSLVTYYWSLVTLFFLASAACTYQEPHEEDFQAGMEAYAQRDYQTAMEKWRPLAEDGNTSAQVNMGVIYYEGLGVPRD